MSTFHFKKFAIRQSNSALKVGTDAMVLGAFVDVANKKKGLDIGTGTGVLALMQVQKSLSLKVLAVELDSSSCEDAFYNFKNSNYSDQLLLENIDFLKLPENESYDLLFSNPPYYQNTLKGEKQNVNLAKHVQELTPVNLFKKVHSLLELKGEFWVIWPHATSELFEEIAMNSGLYLVKKIIVNGKPEEPVRIIYCFSKEQPLAIVMRDFTIRDQKGNYTDEYKNLTLEFHNKKL
jgi:tRNA1Val (adenine37-N6)-methyltransferase